MSIIKQLSLSEIQKIAAGEVVERPANVIKELIENSIDAHATTIHLYVGDGGHNLIRVVDDGCGMDAQDAERCFDHHATSKINSVEDLTDLTSFGFRGEALASISGVSSVTLFTKQHESLAGTFVEREAGVTTSVKNVACPAGTDITIRNLFFNVPARKKFLKPPHTEMRHITHLFFAFCFDYPQLHLTFTSNGKQLYNCPPVTSLLERAFQLFEARHHTHLKTLETYQKKELIIDGVISDHQLFHYDRSNIFLFVNKRWIRNIPCTKAILKGYAQVLPADRFPTALIFISVPPAEIDINIHPRKQEIQFLHPRSVELAIQQAVKQTLEKNVSDLVKPAPIPYQENQPFSFAKNYNSVAIPSTIKKIYPSVRETNVFNNTTASASNFESPFIAREKNALISSDVADSFYLIGQLLKTYILVQKEHSLVIVDQHAAHERILYERFKKKFGSIPTISLLFPETLSFAKEEIDILEPFFDICASHGMTLERLHENQLQLIATAVHCKQIKHQELFAEIINHIEENQALEPTLLHEKLHEYMHAQMACKAAVKAGDALDDNQMENLLKDLSNTENRLTCPHGRPTCWHITQHELEKKFKRVL